MLKRRELAFLRAWSLAGRRRKSKWVGRWGSRSGQTFPSDRFHISEKKSGCERRRGALSYASPCPQKLTRRLPRGWHERMVGGLQLYPMAQHFLVVWFCAMSMFGTLAGLVREKVGTRVETKRYSIKVLCAYSHTTSKYICTHAYMLHMHKSMRHFK